MVRIVVVGSVNLDLVARAPRLPVAGETVSDASFSRVPGGKGANQALAARRLGADVELVAAVGRDSIADDALALLRDGGVGLGAGIVVDDEATGVALICVSHDAENQIVVAPGANRQLAPGSFDLPAGDALICQLEVPTDTVAAAVAAFDGFVCVNLAPARHVDVSVIQDADVVVVNETEHAWYGSALDAAGGLVALTMGAAGAELRRGGELVARVPAPKIDAVDTTGAGDTFTAALTLALVEGQAPEDALRFACAAGAAAATGPGAQTSLPTRAVIANLLDS